jgi:hypothetical protein
MDDLSRRRPDGGSIAVVGLGVGTLATYERPADSMTFFEIDPAVIDIARDTHHFTYLADAPHPSSVVLGDARLSLAREPDASYDLIVLDAFSSDAVPPDAHRLYLIQHISATNLNRYLVREYDLYADRLLPRAIADRTQRGWVMQGSPLARTTSANGRFVYTRLSYTF